MHPTTVTSTTDDGVPVLPTVPPTSAVAPPTFERRRVAASSADQALALYRAIFVNAPEAIAIIDTHGRYLEQNAAHRELLDYSDDELRGQTPVIHLGESEFQSIIAVLENASDPDPMKMFDLRKSLAEANAELAL